MGKKLTIEDKIRIFKKFGIILTASTIIASSGIIGAYKVINDNPYNGSVITTLSQRYKKARTKDFLDNDGLIPAYIKVDELTEEEQNAYLLYYALVSNFNLSEDVKKEVRNYIYYTIDNPYLDYEYAYDEFKQLISQKVCGFTDPSILGLYNHDTHTIKYMYLNVTFHELLHADSKTTIPSWFDEALSSLIDDEYNGCSMPGSYGFYKNVLRLLCETIGKERARNILYMCEAEGNINILKEELYRLNLDGDEVNRLFDTLDSHNELMRKEGKKSDVSLKTMEVEIKDILAYFYDETHPDQEEVSEHISSYFVYDTFDLNTKKVYYLNSKLMNNIPYEQTYYYPYETEEYDKIKELRGNKGKSQQSSNHLIYIKGQFYFSLSEEEIRLKDIINPDKVISVVKKYYDNKTVTEYMRHENGDFVIYESSETQTSRFLIDNYIESYNQSKEKKGGKSNG